MPFEVFRTTAEDVIGATDATLQRRIGVDAALVGDFLDIPLENARNALNMAQQLGLIATNPGGEYIPQLPYAEYLVTGDLAHKAAILRFVLEQFQPYRVFKFRLALTDSVNEAATQTRALHTLSAHRGDIISTFVSLGTYTNSLVTEGAGRYRLSNGESSAFLVVIGEAIENREFAELQVRKNLGRETAEWINYQDVLTSLVTAYQRAAQANIDARAPIVYAGNAIESFLVQIAAHYMVNLAGATGINSKADRISQAGHLTDKHKFMIKYLGHIRNAADHGVDPIIGQAWEVSEKTALEYVFVAQSTISGIVTSVVSGRFVV